MPLPERVTLCEVGPRDGFQYEDRPIPTDMKVEVITALADAGLRRIQAASFVHPARVPQMADAEEVVGRLNPRAGVAYAGLVLNRRGLERAHAAGLRHVDVSLATHERHGRDNAGMSVDEGLAEAVAMVEAARVYGMAVQVGFQTVFGYAAPGDTPLERVAAMVERFAGLGVAEFSFADTTGLADPPAIRARVGVLREAARGVPVVLHLHDTRGLGLANIHEALRCGVDRFDTSLAGMGGCPFIPGAAGNVATEDTAYLMHRLGIETGVDVAAVAAVSRRVAGFLEKDFPGKLYRLQTEAPETRNT